MGLKTGIQAGIQEGIQKGIQAGIQEGIQKGRQEAMAEAVARTLAIRFGIEMTRFASTLASLPLPDLENLSEIALTVDTLSDFEANLKTLNAGKQSLS